GADGGLAGDAHQPDLRARGHVRTGAQLTGPGAADVDHAHDVAVLLAEQRHGAGLLRLVERDDARGDLERVGDGAVGDVLDLAARLRREGLTPGEVEAQVAGAVQRARLRGRLAERVAQRRVDEVGRGVRLPCGTPVRG